MDTNRLLQFKILVETGNMRKAAELLAVSNGGLSRSIRVLETELRMKLIVPAGRGIAITEAGKAIYAKIGPLLSQVETLSVPQNQVPTHPRVRIGTFEVFSTYFLGPLLEKYIPQTNLLIREYVPGKLEAAIAEHEVDLGITYLPIPHAGIDFVEVAKIDMGIFGRRDIFHGQAIDTIPFAVPITPVEGSPTGVKGLDGWPDHVFPRNARFQVELMESALELSRAGLAVGYFPKFVIDLHNKSTAAKFHLNPLPLPARFKSTKRSVYLIKRSSWQEDRVMRKIGNAIRAVCR